MPVDAWQHAPVSTSDKASPEEDVVSLVVEGDRAATLEIGVLVEQGGKHSTHTLAQACVEVVQDQLGLVTTGTAMTLQAMRFDILNLSACAAALKQAAWPLALLLRSVTSSHSQGCAGEQRPACSADR